MRLRIDPRVALEDRPDKLPMTLPEWGLSVAALVIFLVTVADFGLHYNALPDIIPTHYGLDGQPDGWGGRSELLGMLAADTACVLVIFVCNFFPQFYNIPFVARRRIMTEVLHATRLLCCWTNICVASIFCYLMHVTVNLSVISNAVMFGILALMFVPMIIYFVYLYRGR